MRTQSDIPHPKWSEYLLHAMLVFCGASSSGCDRAVPRPMLTPSDGATPVSPSASHAADTDVAVTADSGVDSRGDSMVLVASGQLVRCMSDYDGPTPRCSQEATVVPTYLIDANEVTVADFSECVRSSVCTVRGVRRMGGCNWTGAPTPFGDGSKVHHPMNCVTFDQAQEYCRFRGARLPNSLEWEYSARGPSGKVYPWGNERIDWAHTLGQSGCVRQKAGTCEVGSRHTATEPFGLSDMAGNVAEWVDDHPCGTIPMLCDTMLPEVRKEPWRLACGTSWMDPGLDRYEELALAGCRRKAKTDAHKAIGFRCAKAAIR